jgi:hypothetical protein
MVTFPEDLEVPGLIDDGFYPHEQGQFIVHLQPVVLQEMLDAGSRFPRRFVVGLHFAIETLVVGAAQVTEDFLRAEG